MFPLFQTISFIFLLLLSISLLKLLKSHNFNKNIIFYLLSSAILNISLVLFWYYFQNLAVCLILSLMLMALTFSFLLEVKFQYKHSIKLCLPYFILTIYNFAYIINQFLCLAHQ